jgi:D-alanyl-D-alanine dipeptidase
MIHESESPNPEVVRPELMRPIPVELPSVDGWKEVPVKESGEPMAALGPFSDFPLMTDSLYAGERENSPYGPGGLEGSLLGLYLRHDVAEKLVEAEKRLPEGMHLVVWDAFRTSEVQGSLYDFYRGELAKLHPDWTDEQLDTFTQNFVSVPSDDPEKPAPHHTGGSVDLDIVQVPLEVEHRLRDIRARIDTIGHDRAQWAEVYRLEMERVTLIAHHATQLEFGAPRDYGDEAAALNYFEKLQERPLTAQEQEARDNRRLLYNLMVEAGLAPFESEYWHYNDPKSQMGAKVVGIPFAEYGPGDFTPQLQQHEDMLRGNLKGLTIMRTRPSMSKVPSRFTSVVRQVSSESGDLRKTTLPKAEKIQADENAA